MGIRGRECHPGQQAPIQCSWCDHFERELWMNACDHGVRLDYAAIAQPHTFHSAAFGDNFPHTRLQQYLATELLQPRGHRIGQHLHATDNAANAGIVLGGRPIRPLEADLRWIGALCYRNGQLEETGLAAGVLNHPATSVAWLANKIASIGLALEPGQVVLAGSFIRPIETRKGDTIQADYGPYGSVSCYFA